MERLIRILSVSIALFTTGCLSQNGVDSVGLSENEACSGDYCFNSEKPSSKTNSCSQLSNIDLQTLENLHGTLISHSNILDGEYNQEATFNVIEEIGRRGCSFSQESLLTLGLSIEDSKTIDSGRIEFEHLGVRKLKAIIISLGVISDAGDLETTAFLNRFADEKLPIRDGHDGYEIQKTAKKVLSDMPTGLVVTKFKAYPYSWNLDQPNCSSNYLMTDGSRTNFIADFNDYINEILSASPDDINIREISFEPRYCDGYDGHKAQVAAIRTYKKNSNSSEELDFLISVLESDNLRGSIKSKTAATEILYRNYGLSEFRIEQLTKYIEYPGGHKDENVRADLISLITHNCVLSLKSNNACATKLKSTLRKSAKQDPYYMVRLRAQQALDYLKARR